MHTISQHIIAFCRSYRPQIITILVAVALLATLHAFVPRPLFSSPRSKVLKSADGQLLSARIASDGQWRFAPSDSVSSKFEACLLTFEDRRFRFHMGIDPIALARALWVNIRHGSVHQGGSTLTMQLARMARGHKERTLYQKLVEALWAADIELSYSKDQILALYASHAPFGGNVVGIEAAAWRYFGRSPQDLSWAENATLAVLPNAPALINVGRNRQALKQKRDLLLSQLADRGLLDPDELLMALAEPLPDKPFPLPNMAPHLLSTLASQNWKSSFNSTLSFSLQSRVQRIADDYSARYRANLVADIAILVADVASGHVLAYVGNTTLPSSSSDVDMIQAERSTGSILKPFLYAAMMSAGEITPAMLFADTPLDVNGFSPKNFDHSYSGAVGANVAITRSLNVPLVRMLSLHNTGRFMADLKQLGMTTLHFSEDHYGASLILGGAEATLWDLCGMYASMARRLNLFNDNVEHNIVTSDQDFQLATFPLSALPTTPESRGASHPKHQISATPLSASAIWHTFCAMANLNRPEEEADWQLFSSMKQVAWKTGTSYGSRDAWAVGVTPRHVVGVWVGNANGEGRAGLSGVGFAGPVLFDVFSLLPTDGWFAEPLEDEIPLPVCRHSGHRASDACPLVDTLLLPCQSQTTPLCPYCRIVHLSPDGLWQVNSSCMSVSNMVNQKRFVLPPAMEYFFCRTHADYVPLPPPDPNCVPEGRKPDIIYPNNGQVIVRVRDFNGQEQGFVARAAPVEHNGVLHWHLDAHYVSTTYNNHSLRLSPEPGQHSLTVVDDSGESRTIFFSVR